MSQSSNLEHRRLRAFVALLVAMTLVVSLPGCGGCWNTDPVAQKKAAEEEKKKREEDEKKKKKEKPKDDFTLGQIRSQPGETVKDKAEINYVKRGHWLTAGIPVRANNFDAAGQMESFTSGTDGKPFDIEHTKFAIEFARPLSLPKGQVKTPESLFFFPRERPQGMPGFLRTELSLDRGVNPPEDRGPVTALEEWQYLFLVLSTRPSVFTVLDTTQTFGPRTNTLNGDPAIKYYQLIRPSIEKSVPLPSNPLTWTSIAVILWDDIDPTVLTPEQQQAMLDWLNWGGQLILSGPNSLDRLNGTFLEPFLPAESSKSINLEQESFAEFNEFWSNPRRKDKPSESRDLRVVKPIAGIELELVDDANFLPHTGKLVAERRVGYGRIVTTAFPLASEALRVWPGFDGFLNGGLLRRPGRAFVETQEAGARVDWINLNLPVGDYRRDPRLVSNIRFFTRDIGYEPNAGFRPYPDLKIQSTFEGMDESSVLNSTALEPGNVDDWRFAGNMAVPKGGVGTWNDFSGASNAARLHLNDAAGVVIPKADFVVKMLAAYLFVLVPLNWAVFRLMGRVEWAWFAAPVISLVAAVTVVRMAQLELGFVRSRTEIDVVEIQGDYDRAHVTRYVSLFTSLASYFDLKFDDDSSLALPMAVADNYRRTSLDAVKVRIYNEGRGELHMTNFRVDSAQPERLHCEQMHSLGGKLELQGEEATGWRIKNGTTLTLKEAGILRRTAEQGYQAAYLPELNPGASAPLQFINLPAEEIWLKQWNDSTVMRPISLSETSVTGEMKLGRFAELAAKQLRLFDGDVRLIAWSPGEIPGITYNPTSAQVSGISFVVAHLKRGQLPAPVRDANVLQDVKVFDLPDAIPQEP